MPISKTPKAKQQEDEPMFGAPTAQIFEDVDGEDDVRIQQQDEDRLKALEDRLTSMQTALDEANRTNLALLTNPQQFRSQTKDDTFVPEKIELPDPALDPEGYAAAVERRAEQRILATQHNLKKGSERDQEMKEKVEGLWEDFADTYPDLALDQDRVEFAATQVIKKAQRKGIDPQRYMFVTTDKFINDVAKQMEKTFGKVEIDDDEDDEDVRRTSSRRAPVRNPRRRRVEADDDGGDRTAGIFGGTESGGRPSKSRRDEDEGPTMIDDIQKLQKATGFF